MPLGLVLRRPEVAKLGLISTLAGYATLMASGAAAYVVLHALGAADLAGLLASSSVKQLADPPATGLLVSVCGAIAGLVITASYRNSVIAGALVAMRLIDAAAAIGVGLAAGAPEVAVQALQRFGLDAALIAAAGVVVVFVKQRFTHQRAPLH